MRIRTPRVDEAAAIRLLIIDAVTANKDDDFSDEGWIRFQEPNTVPLISERLTNEKYLTLVCEIEGHLVGIITIKDHAKIDQLFVSPGFRRRGVAKALWSEAYRICGLRRVTKQFWVKSSTMGVSMYKSFGFLVAGPKQTTNGIAFYPMELSVQTEVSSSLERSRDP